MTKMFADFLPLTALDKGRSSLGACPNLKMIYLNGNQLTGSIPSNIGNWQSIQRIFFQDNSLSGSIPAELYDLSTLIQLDIGFNQMSGGLSNAVGGLTNMDKLVLVSNDFSGPIPSEIGDLPELRLLQLSDNSFDGSIPSSIGNLSNLHYLHLSENELTGGIPPSFSNLDLLIYFTLDDNDLSGTIPTYLTGFNDLHVLWLHKNGFSAFPDFNSHSAPGQMAVNISYNHIPQADIDANIVSGSPIFQSYVYNNQTPLPYLDTPENLTVSEWGDTWISLGWQAVSSATGYVVERSQSSGSGYAEVVTLAGGTTTYNDTGVSADQMYYYRIKATASGGGTSGYSNEVSVRTAKDIALNTDLSQQVRFNGNITAVKWQRYGDKNEKVYTYHYDQAGRLITAQYAEGNTVAGTWSTVRYQGGFSLHNLSYDPNGNIESLNRQSVRTGLNTMDALTYAYNGNQLASVLDDAGSEGYRDSHNAGIIWESLFLKTMPLP